MSVFLLGTQAEVPRVKKGVEVILRVKIPKEISLAKLPNIGIAPKTPLSIPTLALECKRD